METLLKFLYPVFESLWRRWFGSDTDIPIFNSRVVQHIVGFCATFSILWYIGTSWWQNLLACAILQGLFWAKAHGEIFDFGHSQPPDTSRYDDYWYWKYLKEIMPEEYWYGFECDYVMMTIRYSLPAFLLALVLLSPLVLVAGLLVSSAYAVCWFFYDWGLTKKPTEIAECVAGLLVGLTIALGG